MSTLILPKLKDSFAYYPIVGSYKLPKDRTLLITGFGDTTSSEGIDKEKRLYGLSIIESKKLSKKLIEYEHILLEPVQLLNLFETFLTKSDYQVTKLFECYCKSEIVRVTHFKDGSATIDIFDNYIHKCPKGVKDTMALRSEEIESVVRPLYEAVEDFHYGS